MADRRKICVITGARAEYGLLYWLLKAIESDPALELQLVVAGMHLSPEFGLTWRQIEADGFVIRRKVEMLLSSDTPTGIAKSMGVGLIGFADALEALAPDLLLVLGDRFEILAAASAALVARIPIAHLHGGEATEGAVDEAIRHAVTKMAHLHFTAAEAYRRRVVQLGERPERVFNVGAVGSENIRRLPLLARAECEAALGLRFDRRNLLITFHPATLEAASAERQFGELLAALDVQQETALIFTKPNADAEGRVIGRMIDRYVAAHPQRAVAHDSLGQLRYLSAMQFVDGVVGNSSSGLTEAPSFRIGTVNIGDRQRGRIKAQSVIDCAPTRESIAEALQRLYSPAFRERLDAVANPYDAGGAEGPAEQIVKIIRDHPLHDLLKKRFFDWPESRTPERSEKRCA